MTTLLLREVVKLETSAREVSSVHVVNLESGEPETYRARRYVMAAGAMGTPLILQRSGIQHSQLGANYMLHYSPVIAGMFTRNTGGTETFIKQLGFTDFYFGTPDCEEKMGLVQSLPIPGLSMVKKGAPGWVPNAVLHAIRRHMVPLAGIVEDLPNPKNAVRWQNDRPQLTHAFSTYDIRRGDALAKGMKRLLRRAGALFCLPKQLPPIEHVGHQCGTARFGTDPKNALATPECRLFELENTFVVDGSILPTSTGVGPSLTLIANALRVAEVLCRDLGIKSAR